VGEKATLEIQRGKQTITYQIPVREKQDVQERLADLVTREQATIPQLGILALTLDETLVRMLPPLRNRFGVVVTGKETYGAYEGGCRSRETSSIPSMGRPWTVPILCAQHSTF
jgi:hypothetical protein